MLMHPVSAALFEWKVIAKRVAGRDGILGDEGNAVHKVWQNESVPMNARWHLQLVYNFRVKSVSLLWRISLRAIGLLDCDDGYLFAQNFKRNLLYEETHGFRGAAQCIPDQKAYDYWQKYFANAFLHTKTTGVSTRRISSVRFRSSRRAWNHTALPHAAVKSGFA